MNAHHEHEFEAAPGLPEALPAGERILWQGSPNWRALSNEAFHLKRLAQYFVLMLVVQAVLSWEPGMSTAALLGGLAFSGVLASVALGLLALTAWLSARTTLYTLTDKRVVMRIGIVLTLTFNLPLSGIQAARVRNSRHGIGNIALSLRGPDRIAFLNLWPHVRPWHVNNPEPMLRCLPDVDALGRQLEAAWSAVHSNKAMHTAQSHTQHGPRTNLSTAVPQ